MGELSSADYYLSALFYPPWLEQLVFFNLIIGGDGGGSTFPRKRDLTGISPASQNSTSRLSSGQRGGTVRSGRIEAEVYECVTNTETPT